LDHAGHETEHLFPQFLPDGRHFLYLALAARMSDSVIYVGALGSAERTMVMRGLTSVAYDPSGRLLFGRDGVLMAQPFDRKTFSLSGEPTTIAEHAYLTLGYGSTLFSASTNGVVAYRNTEPLPQVQLTWVDRRGKPVGPVGPPGAWEMDGRVSPDGKKLALGRVETVPARSDLWMIDLDRGTAERFTNDLSWDDFPIWSPDGRRIVFSSDSEGSTNLYVKQSDGATKEERLRKSTQMETASDWSPDGASLVYQEWPTVALWQLPLSGDRTPVPLVQNTFHNSFARFSPDGRWLAYQSDESGRMEIYIQPMARLGERVRISINGGIFPHWRRDGKELFYVDGDNRILAIELRKDDLNLEPGSPSVLFSADRWVRWFEVASDGQRFLMALPVAAPASLMTVVLDWPAAVKK
jgi:eukaryotic-like serine/threonine-protein kinase